MAVEASYLQSSYHQSWRYEDAELHSFNVYLYFELYDNHRHRYSFCFFPFGLVLSLPSRVFPQIQASPILSHMAFVPRADALISRAYGIFSL